MTIKNSNKGRIRRQFIILISFLVLLLIIFYLLFSYGAFESDYEDIEDKEKIDPLAADYETYYLDNSPENKQIKYGFELFTNTAKYLGPSNGKEEMIYSGNNLACNNCHLNAGTKPYSGMLIGVIKRFPQFRGRENKIGTIEDRINGCMERSMNGKELPPNGKEMKAFVAYMNWLSRHAPEDGKVEGMGYARIEIPDRAVDLEKGEKLFLKKCASCHGQDGQGIPLKYNPGYLYPPLWGEDTYNNGAGMTRVITAAEFIKTNMPYGASFNDPELTDEESYDLAGYINQKERPVKSNPEFDFPDLKKKPVSTPYPPYADPFPVSQHQLGPFQPIMDYYQKEYGITKIK
ncbi:thiosulfate dehydrogenase [Christiangramia gaetbulicola]|uniref:Thiosulfate dehydrogenase n=1 Tax=Christiangramia gaetbulicola TaxID=703340 RepID=A0A2T6AIT7_9FLAO|nr:c-type cytochrome [Christiangramia gaetbulicola]PTX43712.1 thiosulfate dehydrogenase [Christiangramia gaetbulicola]